MTNASGDSYTGDVQFNKTLTAYCGIQTGEPIKEKHISYSVYLKIHLILRADSFTAKLNKNSQKYRKRIAVTLAGCEGTSCDF